VNAEIRVELNPALRGVKGVVVEDYDYDYNDVFEWSMTWCGVYVWEHLHGVSEKIV